MQRAVRILHIAALLFAVSFHPSQAQQPARKSTETNRLSGDDAVVAAREAFANGERAKLANAAAQIEREHPLHVYAEMWPLVQRLRDAVGVGPVAISSTGVLASTQTALDADVRAFIERNPRSYVADRVRLEWLLVLGNRGDFATFAAERPALAWDDESQIRCYTLLNRYLNEGRSAAIAREARALLANTRDSADHGCKALGDELIAGKQLDPLERVRTLVEHNQTATARRLAQKISGKAGDQAVEAIDRAERWLATHERRVTEPQREVALIALARLSREDPAAAARFAAPLNLHLTPEQRGLAWGRIGHMAAVKLMPEATEWYRRGGQHVGASDDTARADEVLEWQVRAALRAGDWRMVRETIARMPAAQAADATWVYWKGRALAATGDEAAAQEAWRSIAPRFEFYGKLAAEELGQPITLPPRAQPIKPEELGPMVANAGFARALKFYDLGLRLEGHREWNWQIGVFNDGQRMTDRQMLAAAEFARIKGVLDRMISTSDRTREEFDFTQRFPSPHRAEMEAFAKEAGLDPNWVYGLIRQESRFIRDARSHVGASGLMQLMPATARWVARKVGMNDFKPWQVNELETNLKLGTSYLRMVYDDLDGQPALASAAYNAGPNRPRSWRAALTRPVDGAIFAETIPFNETRDYVKKVLSNSIYYALLADGRAPSLKNLLGTVSPQARGSTELP